MQLVAGLFPNRESAERALAALEQQGVPKDQISVVMREQGELQRESGRPQAEISNASGDAALGGMAIGGLAGLLLGVGALLIPGVGPVLAIGPLASAFGIGAAATAAGAFTGGIVGGLVGAGMTQEEADAYAEGVKQGGVLVTVQAEADEVAALSNTLRANGAVDINENSSAWRGDSRRGLDPVNTPEADFPPLKLPKDERR
jgi:hypothetical protein